MQATARFREEVPDVGALFGAVESSLASLAAFDPTGLDPAGLPAGLRALQQVKNRLGAIEATWLAVSQQRHVAGSDDPAAMAGWMRDRLGVDTRHATRQVDAARAVTDHTPVAAALTAGDISSEHAAAIGKVVATLDEQATIDPDTLAEQLTRFAKSHTPAQTARKGREQVMRHDPDRGTARTLDQMRRQYLAFHPQPDGLVRAEGRLTAENAEYIRAACAPFLTPDPPDTPTAQRRGAGERFADALGQVARAALAAGDLPDSNGTPTHAIITFDWDWLLDHTNTRSAVTGEGEPLSAETIKRILCDTDLSRVITGPDSQTLDVGRKTSVWPTATRRAILARDRNRCRRCGKRAQTIHHITHWANGGHTRPDNGIALCLGCHITVHEHGETIYLAPDGTATFTTRDSPPTQRPPP